MEGTAERIFCMLNGKGIEQKEFASLLGVTDKTVSAWKTGRSSAFVKRLPQIAEILDTSVEYLLTGQKEKPAPETVGELRNEVTELLGDLTQEEWKQIIAFAAGLKAGREAPASDHA